MKHVAIIEGISGCTRFLAKHHEVTEIKKARKFPSPESAGRAAQRHIESFPSCIARAMKFSVQPVTDQVRK
jgi:hypothetical protein